MNVEDDTWFWSIVDHAYDGGRGGWPHRLDRLRSSVAKLPDERLLAFDAAMARAMDALQRDADVHAAATDAAGLLSDDAYADFCAWVVSMGHARYLDFLRSPRRALEGIRFGEADGAEEDLFFEEYGQLASEIREERGLEAEP